MCPRPRPHRGRASSANGQNFREVGLHQCPSERKRDEVPVRNLHVPSHVPSHPQNAPKCGVFRFQPRDSSLRQTGCWRKPDSNRRYRATPPTFRERLMSRLSDSPRRESRREREPKPRGEAATRCARCCSKASARPSSPHPPASADRRDRGIPRDHLGTHLPSTTPCSRPRSSITFRSGSRTNRETCPLSPKLTGP